MYLGSFAIRFNGHNRITIPKQIRAQILDNRVVLMQGDGCIWGFDSKSFEAEARIWLNLSLSDAGGRLARRRFFPQAVECVLDEQNRLVIPEELLTSVAINQKMVIVGAGDHFELWSLNSWQKYLATNGER